MEIYTIECIAVLLTIQTYKMNKNNDGDDDENYK